MHMVTLCWVFKYNFWLRVFFRFINDKEMWQYIITRWPGVVPQSTKLNCFTLLYYNILYCTFSTFLLHFTRLYSTLLHNKLFITCKVGQKSHHMVVVVWSILPILEPPQSRQEYVSFSKFLITLCCTLQGVQT